MSRENATIARGCIKKQFEIFEAVVALFKKYVIFSLQNGTLCKKLKILCLLSLKKFLLNKFNPVGVKNPKTQMHFFTTRNLFENLFSLIIFLNSTSTSQSFSSMITLIKIMLLPLG